MRLRPVRTKLRQSYFALIGLYAVLGVFMVVSVFLASGITPRLLHVNYDSIAAAEQMREAWEATHAPERHPEKSPEAWAAQFEKAAAFAEGNVSEPGEREIVTRARELWRAGKWVPEMNERLSELRAVNERGMFKLAEQSTTLGQRVFLVSILFFLVTFIFAQRIGKLYRLHDVTESLNREKQKSEFIGVLSHELKTPLQSLGTAAELLANRAPGMDEDTRMLIETLNEDVNRIRAVASDFIQVGVVDLHSLKLKLEKVPLSELIQEWIKPFRLLARDKSIQVEYVKEGADVIWANLDIVKFPWAISNLMANAIRVSDHGSRVTVYVTDRGNVPGMAEIEIRDDGPGIPETMRERIFEPYFQASAADGASTSGFLGLGLTIAREVVEAHEGRIDYFPRRPRGSSFRIQVPRQGVT